MIRSALTPAWLILATGCGGATVADIDVVAPGAKYPISLTPALADEQGLVARDRIRGVATFNYASDGCVANSADISDEVNRQIEAASGHAITKLEIAARPEGGCAEFRLKGEIVQVAPRGGASR